MANETIYLIAHCTVEIFHSSLFVLSYILACMELGGILCTPILVQFCIIVLSKPLKHGMHETAWQFYKSGIKNSSFKEVSPKSCSIYVHYPLWCSLLYIIELHQVFSGLPKCMCN